MCYFTGSPVFQRVYHHVSNKKMPSIQTYVSPRKPSQQLGDGRSEKRRSKPPSNWWIVDNIPECSSSQPQEHETKNHKERKKQPKQSKSHRLGSPKNGNTAVSSKPLGRVSTPSQKLKAISAPKTVKRSLATFKDIFTSATEAENVRSKNRRNVADDVEVFLQNHENAPSSKCLSENM